MSVTLMKDVVLSVLLIVIVHLCWLAFKINVKILVQVYAHQMQCVKL